ncbi:MAG: DNA pilot protein [Microvirus sp.]|nr:MAG: DNA pilot protein [Microvirus sp.]
MSIFDLATNAVKWIAPAALAPLTGGASLAAYGVYGQNSANKANQANAQAQMDFQERMSNTEIQRRAADLKAAGLNPSLAVTQGGASSATGARAEVQNPLANATNSAIALRTQAAQLAQMDAQTKLLSEQARGQNIQNVISEKGVPWSADKAAFQQGQLELDVRNAAAQLRNLEEQHNIQLEDLLNKRLTNTQLEQMQPLLKAAQEIANELDRLNIPEAKVNAQWFSDPTGSAGKISGAMKDILQIVKMLRGGK